jgi:hypothetical protein
MGIKDAGFQIDLKNLNFHGKKCRVKKINQTNQHISRKILKSAKFAINFFLSVAFLIKASAYFKIYVKFCVF